MEHRNPRGRVRSGTLFVVAAALWLLAGCDHEPKGSIIGVWTSDFGDSYTITSSNVAYDDGGFGLFGFTGTIEKIVEINAGSGIIYFKYATLQSGLDAGVIDKYNAIYYINLTLAAVQIATAIDTDYSIPATTTLAEARTKFTAGTVGDYVSLWSACTK
jgi:hypothetical protein